MSEGSPHPPPVCSIHLDDATAAILHQNAHHTPAYWWRGDRVMKPISVWGWLGGYDGQRAEGEFGQDASVTPSFSKDILGFLMTTETTFIRRTVLVGRIVSPSLYWGIRTHTDHRVSIPCWQGRINHWAKRGWSPGVRARRGPLIGCGLDWLVIGSADRQTPLISALSGAFQYIPLPLMNKMSRLNLVYQSNAFIP